MDINARVAAQRAAAEQQRIAQAAAYREQQAQFELEKQRIAAENAALDAQLRPLGDRFVQWARRSRIRPTVLKSTHETTLFGSRTKSIKGWSLHEEYDFIPDPDHPYPLQSWHGHVAVLPDGTVTVVGSFRHGAPQLSPGYIERLIVDFIVKSGSRAPWPG